MSELFARLQGDLNSARKSQDKAGVLLLGTVLSEVKNKKIELKRDPTDADVIDVLRKSIKRRRESVEMYTKGNRAGSRRQGIVGGRSAREIPPRAGQRRRASRSSASGDRRRRNADRCSDGQGSPPIQRSGRRRNDQRHRSRGAKQAGVRHAPRRITKPELAKIFATSGFAILVYQKA